MGSAAEQPEATRGSQIPSSRRDESAVWTEGFRDRFHGIVSPLLFNGLVLLASTLLYMLLYTRQVLLTSRCGTFAYHCMVHLYMVASIVVKRAWDCAE